MNTAENLDVRAESQEGMDFNIGCKAIFGNVHSVVLWVLVLGGVGSLGATRLRAGE